MACSRYLYYCVAFGNAWGNSWDEYRKFNSCSISNCRYSGSYQFTYRKKTFELITSSTVLKNKNSF